MTKKYQLYVVPHTHWDREWYGSFQLFRVRLVRLMNKLLDLLDRNPDYTTFLLDGQTIILEDYLEVHPENRQKLIEYVTQGRLKIGPWYILPDEFLSSGESIVRNLLLGQKTAGEFGRRMNVGYIPDTFGHIAQLPQILQGAGLDTCMNFRGLDSGNRQSELWWESPDGSQVLLHHMSTIIGYSDLGAMALDQQRAAYDLRATAYYKAERSTGNVLLAMQGVDHVEAREDLAMVINIANDTFDDVEFIHASLEDFWDALKVSVQGKTLETVYGELRDVPRTDGSMNFLLYNVLSSRIDNKLQNAKTLLSLEKWAEPWCALAWMWEMDDYPTGHLWTAWKWLLKNHPHDSLGGCSVDEVHRQMNTRFEWAHEIADYLVEERFRLIADRVDSSSAHRDEVAVILFNASPWERDEVVTVNIDLPEYWLAQQVLANQKQQTELQPDSHYLEVKDINTRADWLYGMPDLPEVFFRSIHIRDYEGNKLPVQIHDIQNTTQAIALASGPRGVMDIRRVQASFRARIPAYGYTTYFVKTGANPIRWKSGLSEPNMLENEYLKVKVNSNGTFDLVRKNANDEAGDCFEGLGLFVDSGDNGDGYTFSPPPFNRVYNSLSANPRIASIGTQIGIQHIRIEYDLEIPVGLDETRQRRRDETVVCPLFVDLILREGSPRLELQITVKNRAKDHRLQLRFPTGFADIQEASSAMQFDVMTRPVQPEPISPDAWWVEDPASTFPMHGWTDVSTSDGKSGLCVVAEGVYEFAVDTTSQSADISLTLLRAVGYLGARRDLTTIVAGAGPGIPTPEAQLQGDFVYRIALYPHAGRWEDAMTQKQADEFLTPPRVLTLVPHSGDLPPKQQGLQLLSENVTLSSLKQSEDGTGLVVRLYNPTMQEEKVTLVILSGIARVFAVNLLEQVEGELTVTNSQQFELTVQKKKIATLKIILS